MHPLRVAALAVSLSLGLAGCETLCAFGIGECAPCEAVNVPEFWAQPHLEGLIPTDDAVVCATAGEGTGKATLTYRVPDRVNPANIVAVTAAQGLGWVRTEDNWSEASDTSQLAKSSTLELARGDTLRIDVISAKPGTQVVLTLEGAPPPPELRGDVTVFAYAAGTFALYDGRIAALPGVRGGVYTALPDGFFFRVTAGQYGQYRPDGTATVFPEFPADVSAGSLCAHGPGPHGGPWVSYNPGAPDEPAIIGELIDGAWELHGVSDIDPPLPSGSLDVVHTPAGAVWVMAGRVVYAHDTSGWHATKLRAERGALHPFIAQGEGVLISAEHGVVRAKLDGDAITVSTIAELQHYPELRSVGDLGVVAHTDDAVTLISGEVVTKLELPGELEAPDLAATPQGFIAVATKDPPAVLVRDPTGTITRYPATGALPSRVMSLDIDAMGRVWMLMVDGDPYVADSGTLIPLEGLVGGTLRPVSISFMGNGAPPFLEPVIRAG